MLLNKRCCFQIMQFQRLLSCQKHWNNLDIGCNSLANFTITTALAATSSNQRFLHTTNNKHTTTLSKTTNATSNEENVIDGNEMQLDKKFLTFDQRVDGAQNILLKLQRGRSRTASFQISLQPNAKLVMNFPKILLPEEAYLMVREMDELIGALPTTALKAPATTNVDNVDNNVPEFLPGGRQFDGEFYGYRLDMCWWRGKLQFCMRTKQTVQEHRGRHVIMPAQALPWLRMTMAQMLEKHDGTQQLRPMPEMPKWILSDKSGIQKRPILPRPDQRPRQTTTQLNMKNRRQQQQLQSVQHQNKPQQQQLITQLSAKIEQLQQQLSAITLNHSKDSNMAAQPEQQLTNQLAQLQMQIAQQMAQSTQMTMSMLNLFRPQIAQPLQQLAQPQLPQVAQQPLVQPSSLPLQQPQMEQPQQTLFNQLATAIQMRKQQKPQKAWPKPQQHGINSNNKNIRQQPVQAFSHPLQQPQAAQAQQIMFNQPDTAYWPNGMEIEEQPQEAQSTKPREQAIQTDGVEKPALDMPVQSEQNNYLDMYEFMEEEDKKKP